MIRCSKISTIAFVLAGLSIETALAADWFAKETRWAGTGKMATPPCLNFRSGFINTLRT